MYAGHDKNNLILSILPQNMEKAISYNPFLKVLQSFFIMMRGAIKKISGVNQVGLSQGIEYKENVQLLKFLAG